VIETVVGATFEDMLESAPTGLVGQLGFAVVDASDPAVVVVARRTTGIAEVSPGVYWTSDVAPLEPGLYVTRWDYGGTVAAEGLRVDPAPALPPGPYPWAPSVEEVAEVTPAYTRGGFDDDRESAGAEQETSGGVPTFTDDTVPNRTHVAGLILAACEEVAGRVGVTIPLAQYGLARITAKWHVAAAIAAAKQPAGTDDASGEYRGHILNFRNSLDALIALSRTGYTRLA
jgi:hypothetical protein